MLRKPDRAARLLGAADALEDVTGIQVAQDRIDAESSIAPARAALDPSSWGNAYQEGQTMTLEQTVEYALQEWNDE